MPCFDELSNWGGGPLEGRAITGTCNASPEPVEERTAHAMPCFDKLSTRV